MPTNKTAKVKMTPKLQARFVSRDLAVVAQSSKADSAVKQPGNIPSRTSPTAAQPPAPNVLKAPVALHSSTLDNGNRTSGNRAGFPYLIAKRTFDSVLGSILLIVAIPIVTVAAVAIRFDTRGSPFFFQTRLGRNGKPFKLFKLRGMFIDARDRFPGYYDYSGKRDLEFCFHHEDDPRVTRAGRFLRRTSIDELPNLWNVVKGDLSLVGPRPEIPEVLALYGAYRDEYLSVKPGITCLSKVTGRDRLTKKETIEFDLQYIRRRSFSVDLSILWRTFSGVVLRRDVF